MKSIQQTRDSGEQLRMAKNFTYNSYIIQDNRKDLSSRCPSGSAGPSTSSQASSSPAEYTPTEINASYQAAWNLHNLPDILYALRPRNEHARSRARVQQTKSPYSDKTINFFPTLPPEISPRVEGWRIEAWIRIDRRIMAQDIADRIHPRFNILPEHIEGRRCLFRKEFNVACWGSAKSASEIAKRMRDVGLDPGTNSTRGLTPGLIDPSKGEAGGRVQVPPDAFDTRLMPVFQYSGMTSTVTRRCEYLGRGTRADPISLEDTGSAPPTMARIKYNFSEDRLSSYGEVRELAYHGGPPAKLLGEDEAPCTMSLDEYLGISKTSYVDWVYRDFR